MVSVRDQQVEVEHVIIDGGSKDTTLSIAHSYPHVCKMVSEPDKGIYDAMNKGIKMSSGDIVGILNSDDYYAEKHTLRLVAEAFSNPKVQTCYGDLLYVDPFCTDKVTRCWKSGDFRRSAFYWGWMPPHPTFFVRRSVYEQCGVFNLKLGSAADYELMLRFLVKHSMHSKYIPEVLVKMRTGGQSNASMRNRLIANRMDRLAWDVNDLRPYPWTLFLKPVRKIGQFMVR